MRISVQYVLVLVCVFGQAWAQPDISAGQRSYEICAGCHGFLGEGSELVGAPRLTGIESWYLETQMRNFANGIRGHAEGDANGRRMALMSQAVDSERELEDLSTYIASLPSAQPETSPGDASQLGSSGAYAICTACHGRDGTGNEALGAPGLVGMDAWYLVEQLRLYADGLRGTHPTDTLGAQMVAIAASFDTEEKRRALAEAIRALRR
ncbi:MAG TPA: c-type cytochrome [Gammaproteobacteria bacterium]